MDSNVMESGTSVGAEHLLIIDKDQFRQNFNKRHFTLQHRLTGHPLLALPRLLELARDTAQKRPNDLYYDTGVTDIDEKWGQRPLAFPVDETIRRIESAGAWIALKGAEQDPAYAKLLDDCMSDLLEVSGRDLERNMRRKEVIVFITSPGRLTTYHIDSECNFLLQVQGTKVISIFRPDDREVLPEEEIEAFWTNSRNAAQYKPQLQDHADEVKLGPRDGVHIPINAPHWVRNGDEISIAVSINYHSYGNERANIYRMNYFIRKMGLKPTPPFQSPVQDFVKRRVGSAVMALRGKAGK
ncbi:transcription factor jumonji JmjC domain protein [Methylocella silvestris BL2]|uniref:Transcription factor jumonji JmjC domain protein n=1 Tax=Methylocella silvestris (strain DSM 15510 / CIP 108128 / LMG 27833 / NCIMB 13906 / BL2) TaxID=395965 RepID=B8EKA7_METSB|nr:cupin-like domain-containing protein [Methylocella silvestris]ACK50647.1 transcription factor jumonji JmjC domain protein [Methylocella silvestris BL2]